jgi:hypothetical protein
MTDKQINQVIAEACGFRDLTIEGGSGFYKGFENGAELRPDLPDYVNDLNAMHEAELSLDSHQLDIYVQMLMAWHGTHSGVQATAIQRAEAFLLTLGKWEEVQK